MKIAIFISSTLNYNSLPVYTDQSESRIKIKERIESATDRFLTVYSKDLLSERILMTHTV